MKIILAKTIGFCCGAKRAWDLAQKSLKEDKKPVYFLGEILHNKEVIKILKKQGGIFISDPSKVEKGTLIIRAHGVGPFKIKKSVLIRDLTCPFVKRIQKFAWQMSKEGYEVVIIGKKRHPEVRGIKEYAGEKAMVVENCLQAQKLKKYERMGVVIQSTFDKEKTEEILKILKKKAKNLNWINTLCPEVFKRQREALKLAKKVEVVLVIGSKKSSNTNTLVNLLKKTKKKIFWISHFKELEKISFSKISKLGIISGNSVPIWTIEKIYNKLKEKGGRDEKN